VSSTGRLQDALWDLLIGHETEHGAHVPGLLADLPYERVRKVIDSVVDTVLSAQEDR
jgi:hypothetical protein